jgi:hypothetical protein
MTMFSFEQIARIVKPIRGSWRQSRRPTYALRLITGMAIVLMGVSVLV